MTNTVLILGSSGRFGRHAATAFEKAGWTVRAYRRGQEDLTAAAQGADVIVNAMNPSYEAWAREVPGLTRQVIAAAKASGATVIIPGNVYVFGADAPEVFSDATPHGATNPLGRIRVEMEAAYRASGVRTIVLRAGDFIDTEASGNWFDAVVTKSVGKGTVVYPGNPDIPHAWAYLPDVTAAAVALAERREQLPAFADVPMPGYTLTGREFCARVEAATGRNMRLKKMNWLPVRVLALALPLYRGLIEMSYLWNKPHRLDGSRLAELVPGFEATPVETALAQALGVQVDPDKAVA